ncbi:MAG: efflux RND transporter periplasmic adaptor subunit, partial [Candidatus Omnitrophica bacterium]|nr:efflux RND transporter periplasmic adaptor subunit [Candidatus Omnitrophota bacterium]
MRRLFFYLFLIVFILNGCAKKEKIKETKGIPVEVAKVEFEEIKDILKFTGTVEGKEQVQVFPKVGGKLIKYLVKEGDFVKKDDVIALIDRDITGFKYEPHKVQSPISGEVLKADFDKGSLIDTKTSVAIVGDISKVKVKIEIAEVDYPKVKVGDKAIVKVDAYPARSFEGKLTELDKFINPQTRTAQAEIEVSNDEDLLIPGSFARITLFVGIHKALTMPLDALLRMPGTGSYYCFKVENDKAKKVFLKIGVIQDNLVEIREGLNQGDLVIV